MLTNRRTLLTCAAAVCGGGLLSACGGGSGTASGTASGEGSGGEVAGSADAAPEASVAAGAVLVALDDVEVGGVAEVEGPDGTPLLVVRPTADTAAAFSAVCPHEGCTVSPDGGDLGCPCHGSRFALSGERLGGPAPTGLSPVAVQVVDGQVMTA